MAHPCCGGRGQVCSCPVAMDKLGLPERGLEMKRRWDRGGGKSRMKPRQGSDQGFKFNIQHCVYIGKAHRPHPLFQLNYVAMQGQRAVFSSKFL